MNAMHFDNLALALALAAVLLRIADRPWASNLCSSLTILCGAIAGRMARRRQLERELAEARRVAAAARSLE